MSFDGWGTSGDCSLPSGIAALALNVTAVDATQQTNLRFYPDGSAVPDTTILNPTPGAAPPPNAVNVSLSETNGKFAVHNRFGTVAVVIDVMGYYDHHTHDDLYYRESEVDAALDNVEAVDSDALGGFPAERYPRFTAVIRMSSGSDGYVVEQGTDPGLTVDAVSPSVFVVGDLVSPARSLMESVNCTSGFTPLQMFTVYKSAVTGVTPTRAELHLMQPDGTPLSFNGRAVYCTIWE